MKRETGAFNEGSAGQGAQYALPYHYIPRLEDGHFSQHLAWAWGYRYLGGLLLVLDCLEAVAFDSLLDVGCGDGRVLGEIGKRFPGKRLAGIDVEPRAVALAGALSPGPRYVCGDIRRDAVPGGPFDAVTLVEVLEHIPAAEVSGFLAATAARQTAGGRLVVTVPHENRPVIAKHEQHFSVARLSAALGEAYAVERITCFEKRAPVFSRLMRGVLGNRVFVLSFQPLLDALFRLYRRRFFLCEEAQCGRICAVARKR